MTPPASPIFHLSFPVSDLSAAAEFYRATLGAEIGRQNDQFVDVLLLGAQLTLHNDSAHVTSPMPRTRHFGWTLPWDEWEALAARLGSEVTVVEPPTVSYAGEPGEQGKLMITDPSGNLIELKAYRYPAKVLGPLAG